MTYNYITCCTCINRYKNVVEDIQECIGQLKTRLNADKKERDIQEKLIQSDEVRKKIHAEKAQSEKDKMEALTKFLEERKDNFGKKFICFNKILTSF